MAPFLTLPDEFQTTGFKDALRVYYRYHRCPLCGLIHDIAINDTPERQFVEGGVLYPIQVVQIICQVMRSLHTDKYRPQYTLRILPSFMIRNSRQLAQEILEAIEESMTRSPTRVSMDHGWENIKTLTKYLSRARERADVWQQKLQEQIISLGGTIPLPPLTGELESGIIPARLLRQLASLRHEKQGTAVMSESETRQWFLAVMSASKLGLGPP